MANRKISRALLGIGLLAIAASFFVLVQLLPAITLLIGIVMVVIGIFAWALGK